MLLIKKINIMSWNYRIFAHKDGEDIFLKVHEVYYDEEGNPDGYNKACVMVNGYTPEWISEKLDILKECLDKPIFLADDFPNEYNKNST